MSDDLKNNDLVTDQNTKITAPSLADVEKELGRERKRTRQVKVLKRISIAVVVVAAFAVLITVLVAPILKINGSSMESTLSDKEMVVTIKTQKFEKGDIISFYYNNSILVKRVIATSGDWVNIDSDGNVYVNNELQDEPYIKEKALGECNITLPYQVPDGKIFVMGDNRATSIDSRNTAVGSINADEVAGRLVMKVWPLNKIGKI